MTSYTLSADYGPYSFTGYPTPAVLYAATGMFALSGQNASPTRGYVIDDSPLTLRLDRLRLHERIVTQEGKPTPQFQVWWQRHCEAIEQAFNALATQVAGIQAAYDAAAQASAAASAANNAVVTVQELATTVQATVSQIEDGTYNFSQITLGGQEFGNVGGNVGALP